MPPLIQDEAAIQAQKEENKQKNIKLQTGECEPDAEVGMTQIATRKILNYSDEMIKFINNAGTHTKSTDVHNTFRLPKEIFFTNKDQPQFGLEKQRTTLDTRTE